MCSGNWNQPTSRIPVSSVMGGFCDWCNETGTLFPEPEQFVLGGARESRGRWWDGRTGHTLSQDHPRASWHLGGHPWVDSSGLNRLGPPLKKLVRFRNTCHKIPMYRDPNRSAGPSMIAQRTRASIRGVRQKRTPSLKRTPPTRVVIRHFENCGVLFFGRNGNCFG